MQSQIMLIILITYGVKYLKPRIDASGTLAVLITREMTEKESEWVDREITYAHEQGKRIVGIWDHGTDRVELPHRLDEIADSIVSWNGRQIIEAIFEEKDIFYDREGKPLQQRDVIRHC